MIDMDATATSQTATAIPVVVPVEPAADADSRLANLHAQVNAPWPPTEPVLCPFTILRDSREQAPWFFQGLRCDSDQDYRPLMVPTDWHSLGDGMGDYTIAGAEHCDPDIKWQVSIERKSLPDLFGTILSGRDRFERELSNLDRMDFAAVAIEADWPQIATYALSHWDRNGITIADQARRRKTIIRSILAWQIRFPGVHWALLPTRRAAEVWTFRLLQQFWRQHLKPEERHG